MKHQKKLMAFSLGLAIALLVSGISPVAGAIDLSVSRDTVRANMPFKLTATGLTASTYYTLYIETTLKYNRSTGSSTTLEFEVVLDETYVDQTVNLYLKDSAGSATHDSVQVLVEDIIPQHVIDMVGGLMPYIFVFGVLGALFGIPAGVAIAIRRARP